ncbi:hypothetical protein Glove_242g31 [Diversispora epigaea]|uniref:Uncharacterized protein n=1 Tax=Diversispora epigaea TaxID=1348612 RepID=A0A397I9J8_9GLOM|nr:hypothetical protein Glove_242g31 [Diversispora epigaea]
MATSLKHRHPTTESVGETEPVEILDEQEQEKVIEDLRVQNDRANNFFKKALSFLSLMVMILFFIFLNDIVKSSSGIISIPLPTSEKILSYTPFPLISTIFSISALIFSIYLLQAQNITIIHIYWGAFLSLVPNILAINTTERMEKLWWGIPLGILIFDVIALFLIKDSEQDVKSLEKLKYKYKGA